MSVNIVESYITNNPRYQSNTKQTPDTLVLHTVCGPISAQTTIDMFNSSSAQAEAHAVVDDVQAYQMLPWDTKCYHCGNGNANSIGVEQAECSKIRWNSNGTVPSWNSSDDTEVRNYQTKVRENAVQLFAYLAVKYSINPLTNVLSHKEIAAQKGGSDHADPEELWDKLGWTMDKFREDVKAAMGAAGANYTGSVNGSSSGSSTSKVFNKEAILEKTKLLFNWNIKNNVMSNGTITVRGRNVYQVGGRIITKSDGVEYYVEGVSHNIDLFSGWTTTLSVTRGIEPKYRFTPPFGEWYQMTSEDASKIFNYDVTTALDSALSTAQGTNTSGGTNNWTGKTSASGGTEVTAEFTAYYRIDDPNDPEYAMEGGPVNADGTELDYTKQTCAAPSSIPMGSYIQAKLPGTEIDGRVFKVCDRGGAITQVGDLYHFDILMKDKSTANAFGRQRGTAIVNCTPN